MFALKKVLNNYSLQWNPVGSSNAMEFDGFKNCFGFLLSKDLNIGTFVLDQHSSILKHMGTNLKTITHYFDLWHIKKIIAIATNLFHIIPFMHYSLTN